MASVFLEVWKVFLKFPTIIYFQHFVESKFLLNVGLRLFTQKGRAEYLTSRILFHCYDIPVCSLPS